MTFWIAVGRYGGFYFKYSSWFSIRLCLGWVAFTLINADDTFLVRLLKERDND